MHAALFYHDSNLSEIQSDRLTQELKRDSLTSNESNADRNGDSNVDLTLSTTLRIQL